MLGWRKLLRKVETGSTLSNKFWLCCSFSSKSQLVAQQICMCLSKSTNQRAAFINPQQMFLLQIKLITQGEKRETSIKTDQNLLRNNVARQFEGFCISYFAALKQIDFMLPCVCSVVNHKRSENVVRTSVTHRSEGENLIIHLNQNVPSKLWRNEKCDSLCVAVTSPWGKTFFLGGRVRLHVG